MYARVIPDIRTPRRVGIFDYAVPESMTVARGDLVRIPFRASEIIGLVSEVVDGIADERMPLKPISGPYAGVRFRNETVALLERLAARSFSSAPSILNAWIGACPKRPSESVCRETRTPLPLREERYLSDHVDTDTGVIATARSLAAGGAKTLVLAPWAARAERIASKLDAHLLTSGVPMGGRFAAWSAFVRGTVSCLVTTRIGAWLSTEADAIVIDEPENDDLKQDELSPRYDARWVAETAHALGRTLVCIGTTPRLCSTIRQIGIPTLEPEFLSVDVHGKDWSPVAGLQGRTLTAIEEATSAGRSVTIIHPIHGDRARLRCADCSWEAVCPSCGAGLRILGGATICSRCHKKAPNTDVCAVCGSSNLTDSRPGRERLEHDLRARINSNDIRILSIGEWNAGDSLPQQSLVVCTDLALLSGGVEDLRRKERLILAFRRLADRAASSSSTLCIQANYALLTEAKSWLSAEGVRTSYDRELTERKTFRLPPAFRLAKIIFRGNEPAIRIVFERLVERVSQRSGMAVNGLFPVAHRLPHEQRWIAHLTAPLVTNDDELAEALAPAIESNALIDLDPIAFFE